MRLPIVDGKFYPENIEDLKLLINNLFDGLSLEEKNVLGCVVPHAGYIYSGKTAAYVYSVLPYADTYIIIGPNHTGYGTSVSVSIDTWKTPFGEIESDIDTIEKLSKDVFFIDETAHTYEHSIEVQLPFLQYKFKNFKIISISMGLQDKDTAMNIGFELSKTINSLDKKFVIIASSDFTHYEPDEIARKKDSYFIEPILEMNVPEFYKRLKSQNATVCGYGPISAMLTATQSLAKKVSLLNYSTSGDTSGDYSSVVGYAGIVVMG